MPTQILSDSFFDQPATCLAIGLLGKVLRHRFVSANGKPVWLAAKIIETEAYEITDRGSHSSLGFTLKRKAMFMAPGIIYMYYARGKDSLNFSARGEGNAVLVKSAFPYFDKLSPPSTLAVMQSLHSIEARTQSGQRSATEYQNRKLEKLCNGQTLLCTALNLKVSEWDQKTINPRKFRVEDTGHLPEQIIQCTRLGIPEGRDHQLKHRFVDSEYAKHSTSNPLRRRDWKCGRDYFLSNPRQD